MVFENGGPRLSYRVVATVGAGSLRASLAMAASREPDRRVGRLRGLTLALQAIKDVPMIEPFQYLYRLSLWSKAQPMDFIRDLRFQRAPRSKQHRSPLMKLLLERGAAAN